MLYISTNIKRLRKERGISQAQLATLLGVVPGTISNYENGISEPDLKTIEKIIKILDVSAQDLLYIDLSKEKIKTKTSENLINSNDKIFDKEFDKERKLQKTLSIADPITPQIVSDQQGVYTVSHRFPARTDRELDLQRVPLYELEATAGLVGLFLDASSQIPVSYLSIPNLPRCDGAVYVRGDSMYPLLKSGDIVLYKQIADFNYLVWGEMYLMSYNIEGEEYIAVKFINKIEGDREHILLVSHNPHHAPAEIPISSIRALAMIKASVRYNTIG